MEDEPLRQVSTMGQLPDSPVILATTFRVTQCAGANSMVTGAEPSLSVNVSVCLYKQWYTTYWRDSATSRPPFWRVSPSIMWYGIIGCQRNFDGSVWNVSVSTVPIDGLALLDVRPSACTVMTRFVSNIGAVTARIKVIVSTISRIIKTTMWSSCRALPFFIECQ